MPVIRVTFTPVALTIAVEEDMGLFGDTDPNKQFKKLMTKTDGLVYLMGQNYLRLWPERIGGTSSWVALEPDSLDPSFAQKMNSVIETYQNKYDSEHISQGDEISFQGERFYIKQRREDQQSVLNHERGLSTPWDLYTLQTKCIEFAAYIDSENRGIVFGKPLEKKIIDGLGTQRDAPMLPIAQVPGYEGLGFYLWMLTVDDANYKSYLPSRICFSIAENNTEPNDKAWLEIKMPDVESIERIGATLVHHKLKLKDKGMN